MPWNPYLVKNQGWTFFPARLKILSIVTPKMSPNYELQHTVIYTDFLQLH